MRGAAGERARRRLLSTKRPEGFGQKIVAPRRGLEYCVRVCWATAPAPETHMARLLVMAATGSAPADGACAIKVTIATAVSPAPQGFCLMAAITT